MQALKVGLELMRWGPGYLKYGHQALGGHSPWAFVPLTLRAELEAYIMGCRAGSSLDLGAKGGGERKLLRFRKPSNSKAVKRKGKMSASKYIVNL